MSFMESYKHLEKLCGEILDDDRRVKAYIDEMQNTPGGARYVSSWNADLKKLKHYHWVRNQIAHEIDCTEQNMCTPEDTLWIDNFYSRIMNQTDPITLYRKATTPSSNHKSTQSHVQKASDSEMLQQRNSTFSKSVGCLVSCTFIFVLIAVTLVLLLIWS